MTNPENSWVPDLLPNFPKRVFRLAVDPRAERQVAGLAERLGITTESAATQILRLGLLAAKIQNAPNKSVVQIDNSGNETKVSLFSDQNAQRDFISLSTGSGRTLEYHISGETANSVMEIANTHSTTMDCILEEIFRMGVEVLEGHLAGKRLLFRDEQTGNAVSLSFDFGERL